MRRKGIRMKANQPKAASEAERRTSVRQPFSTGISLVWLKDDEGKPLAATAKDISLTGIQLRVRNGLEPGAVLNLHLTNQAGLYARNLPTRIAWSSRQADGSWLIGASFSARLS